MSGKKTCFIISPIGEAGTPERTRADQLLKHVLKPAAEECGYEAVRADQMAEPGIITSQVIEQIIKAPMVVADLTGKNPNVFYELAIRHAIRKPFVHIVAKGEKIPFDVAGMRAIQLDLHDPDSVADAKTEIANHIKATQGKSPEQIDSPISAAVQIQTLRESNSLEDRTLANLVTQVAELSSKIDRALVGVGSRRPTVPSREPLSEAERHTVRSVVGKILGIEDPSETILLDEDLTGQSKGVIIASVSKALPSDFAHAESLARALGYELMVLRDKPKSEPIHSDISNAV
jgi:hypothetical protein